MQRNAAALVIGNANYMGSGKLANPVNDAEDIAAKLEKFGFDVVVACDASNKEMDKQLRTFRSLLDKNDIGLFFFAGHGMQIEGKNYLLAVDTDLSDETEAKHSSLSLDKVIDCMEKTKAATRIIILDACRDNPWERAWHRTSATRGLAAVYAPKGTIIGFATSPGELASDGIGRNGAYTDALLQHIETPDCHIETMFKRVRNTVAATTKGKQTSWEHTSLSGNFIFNMSLGTLISVYKHTSLSDSLFVIDTSKSSHKIISGLKSYNYYTQNDALALLTKNTVERMSADNLFVLGRNIYQAACGGAHDAIECVQDFIFWTAGFPADSRKAILDGMLFEVFFDPQAKFREKIKGKYFNDLFDLQRHVSLVESFDFIAETLAASPGKFYALPAGGHELAVTVTTNKVKDDYLINAIYVDGVNVLWAEEKEHANSDGTPKLYFGRTSAWIKEELSQELMVPSRLLKLTYTPAIASTCSLKMPLGFTVRKR